MNHSLNESLASNFINDELTLWLILYFLPSLGTKRLNQFYQIESNPQKILDNCQLFPQKAKSTYLALKQNPEHEIWQHIAKNLAWQNPENNQHIIHINHEKYPENLKQIDDPPMLLWVKGNVEILENRQIAVVGSRACTASGIKITQIICKELSENNIQIISGGALGIDSISHQQALQNNQANIAVLGTGVDIAYPKNNKKLFEQIAKQGALISEFSINTPANRFNFPKRNRIISALSAGVLVIEAHQKSGSLITARLALEQNKEVMAVPGSPLSQASIGCNELIAQGAYLIQNAQDILNILNWRDEYQNDSKNQNTVLELNESERKLFNLINDVPQPIEILSHLSGLNFHQTQQQLFQLELKGVISRELGGFILS